MTLSNLSALTLAQLKTLASEANVTPTGDKRLKASWIVALSDFHADDVTVETVSDVELSDAEMEMIAHDVDCANDETAHTPVASEMKGAATVMIVLLSIAAIFFEAVYVVGKALVSLCYYGFTTVRKYYASVNFGTGFLTNYLQT